MNIHEGTALGDGGLPGFVAALRELLPELAVETRLILGQLNAAGQARPLPSSAAKLSVGPCGYWVPWPMRASVPSDAGGTGAIFLRGGQQYVFRTVRLRITSRSEDPKWEFYTLDHWLTAALKEWVFPLNKTPHAGKAPRTVFQRLHEKIKRRQEAQERRQADGSDITELVLKIIGNLVRYALWGKGPYAWAGDWRPIRLSPPERKPWLRNLEKPSQEQAQDGEVRDDRQAGRTAEADLAASETFSVKSKRAQVISAEVERFSLGGLSEHALEKALKRIHAGKGVPRASAAACLRLCPTHPTQVRGIDPFHTPETEAIRRRLYLGTGVRVAANRGLEPPAVFDSGPALSPSTARLPFARYNDPRRILMAAKAQEQAVPLTRSEQPSVVTSLKEAGEGSDPPGVNLRVAYMAWAGWNHEDAWVLSESAAKRLKCCQEYVQSIALAMPERDFQPQIRVGEIVKRGTRLVDRKISPASL